ncbi:MAG: hypothetical protein HKN10_18600, partial [Myxococcales bacterium]|nr:hypothetical protein [Myxococcales bacterium]
MERREMTELRLMLFLCFSVLMAACGGDGVNGGGSGGFAGGTGGAVGNLSIQGSIATPTFAFVDGDTNDPNNPRQDNNFVGEADVQPLGNPGVLGGYLGSIDGSADVDDWYFVSLA